MTETRANRRRKLSEAQEAPPAGTVSSMSGQTPRQGYTDYLRTARPFSSWPAPHYPA